MRDDLRHESADDSSEGTGQPSTPLPNCKVWLIDGYNVLHASLGGRDRTEWWTARRRDELLDRISRLPGDAALWVVFDGGRPTPEQVEETPQRLRVVFAPSADEWIGQAVRKAPEPHRVAVVTGDRPVADRARHRGAQVVSPVLLLAHCPADESAPDP